MLRSLVGSEMCIRDSYKNIQDEIYQKVKNVLRIRSSCILSKLFFPEIILHYPRGTIIFHLLHVLRYRFINIVNLLSQIYLFSPPCAVPWISLQ